MSTESAPQDLVELARESLEAVNRRHLDALMTLVALDAGYDTSPSGMSVY